MESTAKSEAIGLAATSAIIGAAGTPLDVSRSHSMKQVGRRVLVVDDDALVLELVASMLEELGCETLVAQSGTEALRTLVKDQTIEILISDIELPGLDGSVLAECARKTSALNSDSFCYQAARQTAGGFRSCANLSARLIYGASWRRLR
jgi:PleD family two-component response regulator